MVHTDIEKNKLVKTKSNVKDYSIDDLLPIVDEPLIKAYEKMKDVDLHEVNREYATVKGKDPHRTLTNELICMAGWLMLTLAAMLQPGDFMRQLGFVAILNVPSVLYYLCIALPRYNRTLKVIRNTAGVLAEFRWDVHHLRPEATEPVNGYCASYIQKDLVGYAGQILNAEKDIDKLRSATTRDVIALYQACSCHLVATAKLDFVLGKCAQFGLKFKKADLFAQAAARKPVCRISLTQSDPQPPQQ